MSLFRIASTKKSPNAGNRCSRSTRSQSCFVFADLIFRIVTSRVVHYKRVTYLIEPNDETRVLAGSKRQVEVHEDADGRVDIRHEGRSLPYSVYDKQPLVAAGDVVENKRLGAALAFIQRD
jgi:hypothetical protein